MSEALTGVGATFCAAHRGVVRTELHGHSYEVTAWWPSEPHREAEALQYTLQTVLTGFDHKTLPDHLSTGEALAKAIMGIMSGCVGVDIARPLERIYARVRA